MSTLNKRFTATLQKSPNKGGWTFVVMPSSTDRSEVTASDEFNGVGPSQPRERQHAEGES